MERVSKKGDHHEHVDPEPLPVREEILWMRQREQPALPVRRKLPVPANLHLRSRLRLREGEVTTWRRRGGGIRPCAGIRHDQQPLATVRMLLI